MNQIKDSWSKNQNFIDVLQIVEIKQYSKKGKTIVQQKILIAEVFTYLSGKTIFFNFDMIRNNRIAPTDPQLQVGEEPSAVNLRINGRKGVCRICLDEDTNMFKPCSCSGSIQLVHEKCMISWIQAQVSKEPNKPMVCEICHQRIYYEANTLRIWDLPNCMRRLDRLNSCYIAVLFSCILCLIVLSVLLHFGGEMTLTTSGQIVIILGLILMAISTGLIIAAIGRMVLTRKVKSIVKVYSLEEGLLLRQELSYRSRSRRTIHDRSRRTIQTHTMESRSQRTIERASRGQSRRAQSLGEDQ